MENKVTITTEYITLGQLVKFLKLIKSGGEEKEFVKNHSILVNGVADNRRGRKIRPGDKVTIDNSTVAVCGSQVSA
jgi:ribosome-associated protein